MVVLLLTVTSNVLQPASYNTKFCTNLNVRQGYYFGLLSLFSWKFIPMIIFWVYFVSLNRIMAFEIDLKLVQKYYSYNTNEEMERKNTVPFRASVCALVYARIYMLMPEHSKLITTNYVVVTNSSLNTHGCQVRCAIKIQFRAHFSRRMRFSVRMLEICIRRESMKIRLTRYLPFVLV